MAYKTADGLVIDRSTTPQEARKIAQQLMLAAEMEERTNTRGTRPTRTLQAGWYMRDGRQQYWTGSQWMSETLDLPPVPADAGAVMRRAGGITNGHDKLGSYWLPADVVTLDRMPPGMRTPTEPRPPHHSCGCSNTPPDFGTCQNPAAPGHMVAGPDTRGEQAYAYQGAGESIIITTEPEVLDDNAAAGTSIRLAFGEADARRLMGARACYAVLTGWSSSNAGGYGVTPAGLAQIQATAMVDSTFPVPALIRVPLMSIMTPGALEPRGVYMSFPIRELSDLSLTLTATQALGGAVGETTSFAWTVYAGASCPRPYGPTS